MRRSEPSPGVSAVPQFGAVVRPIQAFLRTEAAGGVVLLGCAVVALALANSPLSAGYHALLTAPLGIRLGPLAALTMRIQRDGAPSRGPPRSGVALPRHRTSRWKAGSARSAARSSSFAAWARSFGLAESAERSASSARSR